MKKRLKEQFCISLEPEELSNLMATLDGFMIRYKQDGNAISFTVPEHWRTNTPLISAIDRYLTEDDYEEIFETHTMYRYSENGGERVEVGTVEETDTGYRATLTGNQLSSIFPTFDDAEEYILSESENGSTEFGEWG